KISELRKKYTELKIFEFKAKDRKKTNLITKLKHDVSLIKKQNLQNKDNRYTDNAKY
ncbi:21729_t:CDS:2, partial [Racocetra persica]